MSADDTAHPQPDATGADVDGDAKDYTSMLRAICECDCGCGRAVDENGDRCPMCSEACGPDATGAEALLNWIDHLAGEHAAIAGQLRAGVEAMARDNERLTRELDEWARLIAERQNGTYDRKVRERIVGLQDDVARLTRERDEARGKALEEAWLIEHPRLPLWLGPSYCHSGIDWVVSTEAFRFARTRDAESIARRLDIGPFKVTKHRWDALAAKGGA